MRKSWGFTDKICTGTKVIESRWYLNRYAPWGKIAKGNTIYFKNSGEPVKIKATVKSVLSFENLSPQRVNQLLLQYGKDDGIEKKDIPKFYNLFKDKRYCLLIFLQNVQEVKPFEINKKGFGAMAAWLTTDTLARIKK